jgi:hypothetical protein
MSTIHRAAAIAPAAQQARMLQPAPAQACAAPANDVPELPALTLHDHDCATNRSMRAACTCAAMGQRYVREPACDRRVRWGDDFAADCWRDRHTGGLCYVVVGQHPATGDA